MPNKSNTLTNQANMHLGFDAKRLFFNATGLGNYSRNLVENLCYYYPNNTYHLYAPHSIPEHSFFNQENFILHHNDHLPAAIWRTWSQATTWEAQGIQVYHGLSNELPLKIPKPIKSVVTIHDLIFKTLPTTYSFTDRWIYDKKVKYSCQRADQIIAISQQTKEDLCRYYAIDATKIQVIYQPVHRAYYDLAVAYDSATTHIISQLPQQYFLCVGTLEVRKNQLQILKAWEELVASYQFPIVLVGRGKGYAKQLKEYAERKGIPVIFLENVTTLTDLRTIYQRATVFIYPSLYEGFGLPIIEAQLSNIPVITSNLSATKEAASPAALLIDPTNTEALTAAISSLLSDQARYQKRINEGRTFALSTFHPKKLTEQVWNIYQSKEE